MAIEHKHRLKRLVIHAIRRQMYPFVSTNLTAKVDKFVVTATVNVLHDRIFHE